MQHIKEVLTILQAHQFHVKLFKCSFAKQQLCYLGHIVSAQGVATYPSKIDSIQSWPTSTNFKDLRSFLGLAGYYRRFVSQFGLISKPLTNLLKKGTFFIWTSETEAAFQALKRHWFLPHFCPTQFFSTFCCGNWCICRGNRSCPLATGPPNCLCQQSTGSQGSRFINIWKWVPCHFNGSRALGSLFAVFYLCHTNYKSLTNLDDQRLSTPWQHKALTKLMGLNYKIVYKKGVDNKVADALSRVSQTTS